MKLVKESLYEGLQDSLEFNQWINDIIAEIRVILEDDSERSNKLVSSDIKDDPFETHDEDIEEMFMNNVDPAEAADIILDIMFREIDSRLAESLNEEIRDWSEFEDRDIGDDGEGKLPVLDTIAEIPQMPQVQYSLMQQLFELKIAANKLGLYDAADFLSKHIKY